MNVKKQNGTLEKFDREKLKTSMTKAGVSEANAARVADTIDSRMKEGFETAEIREHVGTELKRLDPTAARSYEAYKPAIEAR